MLSNIQNDTNKFENTYLLTLRMAALIIFPLIVGLAIIAEPLINIILGAEWLPAAEFLTILCFAFMLYPIHAINLNLLKVKGRSDIFLKLEIIKKSLITIMLLITIPMGIKEMCIGMVINSYIALFINSYYTGQFSRLKTGKQFLAIFPIWIIAITSASVAYFVAWYADSTYTVSVYVYLSLSLIVMLLLYIIMVRATQRDLYTQALNTLFNNKLI